MIPKQFYARHLCTIALASLLAWSATVGAQTRAPNRDDAFLAAFSAFRAGDPIKLARQAAALEGHALLPYAEYWQLKLRLDEMPSAEVRAYLSRYSGSYLADRLRAEWLKVLGKRRDWANFNLELAPLQVDDADIRCYTLASRVARGDAAALDEGLQYWMEPRELPDGCVLVASALIASGAIGVNEVWRRVRLLLDANQTGPARRAIEYLPAAERPDDKQLMLIATNPAQLLGKLPEDLSRRPLREMVLFAVARSARSDPRAASELVKGPLGQKLPAADRAYLWGRVAHEGAKRLYPDAAGWFGRAGNAPLSDESLAWKARAALRTGDWAMVANAIDAMSVAAHADTAWTYWYARSLAAQGNAEGARAHLLRLSGKPDFYGLLASEELGQAAALPTPPVAPTDEQLARARAHPGIARALELYRLNVRSEAVREWFFSIRSFDDRQLLAAAEVARRADLHDRAINTADRTTALHDYRLRYLAPYREIFSEQSRAFAIEEAWLFGLTRQESRFIVNAKSSAGAQGLMQLMPATARWVANKAGFTTFNPARVTDIDTNVTLGTRYLRLVLDDLGHPVLASAGYNAGPGRARRWRDTKPLEGAVYVENIPFNETRDYVKKVMANTVWYALVLEGASQPLKARLGTIAARSPSDKFNEDLP